MMRIDYPYRYRWSWLITGFVLFSTLTLAGGVALTAEGKIALLGLPLGHTGSRLLLLLATGVGGVGMAHSLIFLVLRVRGRQRIQMDADGIHLPASWLSSDQRLIRYDAIRAFEVSELGARRVIRLRTDDGAYTISNVMLENDRVFGRLIGAFKHLVAVG